MKLGLSLALFGIVLGPASLLRADPGHWPHDLMVQMAFDTKHSQSLMGWKASVKNSWSIQGHRIVGKCSKGTSSSILWTEDSYTNFILEFDYKQSGKVNAGIMLRNKTTQVQIGWSPSRGKDMTGSLFASEKGYVSEACFAPGGHASVDEVTEKDAWNRVEVTGYGSVYQVKVNGFIVVRHNLPTSPRRGPLGLQVGRGGTIEFRNLILLSTDHDVKNQVSEHYTLWLDESGKSAWWRSRNYHDLIKWGNGGGLRPGYSPEDEDE